jgi:hypothetical protein
VIEFSVTLLACVVALAVSRGAMAASLCIAWIVSLIFALSVSMAYLPATAAIVDIALASMALRMWTEYGDQRARLVGMASLAKLFVHFGVSANFGNGDWTLYAITINALFIVQCGIAGGAINGLGRFIDSFSPRRDFGRGNNGRGR